MIDRELQRPPQRYKRLLSRKADLLDSRGGSNWDLQKGVAPLSRWQGIVPALFACVSRSRFFIVLPSLKGWRGCRSLEAELQWGCSTGRHVGHGPESTNILRFPLPEGKTARPVISRPPPQRPGGREYSPACGPPAGNLERRKQECQDAVGSTQIYQDFARLESLNRD